MLQDPGSAGSCMETFLPTPFVTCDRSGECGHNFRTEKSVWMGAEVSEDPMIRLTTMDQVEAHISRCNVCMGPSLVQTVHSFSTDIPNCPIGFEQIWAGYSYLIPILDAMNPSSDGKTGRAGQGIPTNSPGSCLPELQTPSYLECLSRGYCTYNTAFSDYWLRADDINNTDNVPGANANSSVYDTTIDAKKRLANVSRCAVCKKSSRWNGSRRK